ncbi:hypothetical protein V5O48_009079 [Marasmius crinis-equi]|uniref:Uncharacterized protein n=1 Tax=Marasmius crinis-equi TaxID=585013 RepID=A0ABR3FCA1_9AGAR
MQRFFATLSPFSSSSRDSRRQKKERGRRKDPIIIANPNAMIVVETSRREPTITPYYDGYRERERDELYRSSRSVDVSRHRSNDYDRRHRSRRFSYSRSRSRSRSPSRERSPRHHRDHKKSSRTRDRQSHYYSRPASPSPRHRSDDLRRAASLGPNTNRSRVPQDRPSRNTSIDHPPPIVRAPSSLYTDSDFSSLRDPSPERQAPPLPPLPPFATGGGYPIATPTPHRFSSPPHFYGHSPVPSPNLPPQYGYPPDPRARSRSIHTHTHTHTHTPPTTASLRVARERDRRFSGPPGMDSRSYISDGSSTLVGGGYTGSYASSVPYNTFYAGNTPPASIALKDPEGGYRY